MNVIELLIGIADIAIAMAGFTGVVVAFGSRSQGAWHPGDRLRLSFLLEASLTAAGFSLLALLVLTSAVDAKLAWSALSGAWAVFMIGSLWRSHRMISENSDAHGDVDRIANRMIAVLFMLLIAVQVANAFVWHRDFPFIAAIMVNVAGAAMQFSRLIRSAFHG